MQSEAPAIAMFGGTFDPVHIGHLRSAIELRESLSLDNVHLVVNRIPPHREVPGVTPEDRLAMVEAGIKGIDGLLLDDREITRDGPSYSVLTLESLREQYGKNARIVMAIGLDAFSHLVEWYRVDDIFDLAHIVVIERPGAEFELSSKLKALIAPHQVDDKRALMSRPAGGFMYLPLECPVEVSATSLREHIKADKSIRYLVPEAVEDIILERALYRQ